MSQYRTGKVFVTNASATVFGDVDTDWTSLVAGNWLAVTGDNVTYDVASTELKTTGDFSAYAGGTTYGKCARVTSAGKIWASIFAANVGHTPETNPTYWAECSGWELVLTANYAGTTAANATYGIVIDFTATYVLPLPAPGDAEVSAVVSRAFVKIAATLAAL